MTVLAYKAQDRGKRDDDDGKGDDAKKENDPVFRRANTCMRIVVSVL